MRVLFLGINARFTHVNLALYYLRSYVNIRKHSADIVEKTINDSVWDIISEITERCPDVLCLSCYIWNQSQIQSILRDIKKNLPNLIIVCGGPDISYNASEWLNEFPSIDFIVDGHGEKAFHTLQGDDFQYSDKIIQMTNYPFSEIPLPYKDSDRASLEHRYIYYEASRGCPCGCTYCISSITDQRLEYKDIKTITKELKLLLSFKPTIIKFVDRSFNANDSLCCEIWKFILKQKTETKFHFEINPVFINMKQIELLAKFEEDRIQVEVGIQTIHDKTLKLINRTGNWKTIKSNLDMLSMLENIHLHYDMLVGLPNENLSDIKKSFNSIIAFIPNVLQIGFLKVLPGTPIASETQKYGYKFQALAPYRVYSTNMLSANDMLKVELVELAVDMIYNNKAFTYTTPAVMEFFKNCFQYFHSLGSYLKVMNVNKATTDKAKLFMLFKKHLESYDKNIDPVFLLDCLRFDWFMSQNTHYYPEFLEALPCDVFKKDAYHFVKNSWQELHVNPVNPEYKEKFKNTIFFSANDRYFSEMFLDGCEGACKVDGVVYTVDLIDDIYNITPFS